MEGNAKPERDGKGKNSKRSRTEREEQVRRKYDFSVIRTLRQRRSLTIEKFAKLCGLSYAPISRIETNLIKPNLETLDKIAEGLGIATYKLVAMAEKRDAESLEAREAQAGDFSFHTFAEDDHDIAVGRAPAGASTDRLDIHARDFETLIVQSGRLRLTVNEKVVEIGPGEAVKYDRVFNHHLEALEDTQLILLSISGR
jgi:XRE family transcriptional regulator, regulator of sulfur utilization